MIRIRFFRPGELFQTVFRVCCCSTLTLWVVLISSLGRCCWSPPPFGWCCFPRLSCGWCCFPSSSSSCWEVLISSHGRCCFCFRLQGGAAFLSLFGCPVLLCVVLLYPLFLCGAPLSTPPSSPHAFISVTYLGPTVYGPHLPGEDRTPATPSPAPQNPLVPPTSQRSEALRGWRSNPRLLPTGADPITSNQYHTRRTPIHRATTPQKPHGPSFPAQGVFSAVCLRSLFRVFFNL